jgi:poly [ADP-ribose] polymerase
MATKKAAKKKAKKVTKKKATKKKAVAKKKATKKKATGKRDVDKKCPIASKASVVDDWDAMLNQTNIGANNNKFYVIQLLTDGKKFHVWNRWGRVGETGQSALKGPFGDQAAAEKEFEKKFKSKTSNNWGDRASFTAKKGKYALIEVEGEADDETEEKLKSLDKKRPKVTHKKSELPKELQSFIKLIFDKDMFSAAMADLEIDTKKMPLGQLSDKQVKKGFTVLEDLEDALDKKRPNRTKLAELSSRFYTVIPHSFGRRVPPVIGTQEMLQSKMDMLNVLSDIETALGMDASDKSTSKRSPLDQNYDTLKSDLELVDKRSSEWDIIQNYLSATRGRSKHEIVEAFRVNRHSEGARYKKHDKLENRRLLWHGTNVAVVAAILKGGLRIMPHSGGRVGKGIYMASEQSKSAWYVGRAGRTGIMFLTEAALGKEHTLLRDNWRLKAPPRGHDSIVARGHTEPDPKKDTTIKLDGRTIAVPQGNVIKQPQFKKSYFSQSEYLVYQESQVRLRYVLKMRM